MSRASVTNVQLDGRTAKLTSLNTSQRDITGYSISNKAHLANGRTTNGGRGEDFGPTAFTHKALHPGETFEEFVFFDADIQSIQAEVMVAIYDDHTAEVKDQPAFEEMVAMHQRNAKATQLSAAAFQSAASDPTPPERAKHDFEILLHGADETKVNINYLRSNAECVADAPPGQEHEFLQAEADRLQREAALFAQTHRFGDCHEAPLSQRELIRLDAAIQAFRGSTNSTGKIRTGQRKRRQMSTARKRIAAAQRA